MIDTAQIYQWWDVFREGNMLTEIRLIKDKTNNWSGYFTNPDDIIRAITPFDNVDGLQMYYTINAVHEACYNRVQRDKFVKGASNTSDNEITRRIWVYVDLDPEHGKIKGISSTQEELMASYERACKVYLYLKEQGFYDPVVCMSGNGYHLQYRCDMENTEDTDDIVSRFLKSLGMMFSDEVISVDTSVKNASRICKLYGTVAKKGSNTTARPWRKANIIKVPENIEITDKAYFEKVANLFPVPEKIPTSYSGYSREKFDIVDFLNRHGIEYKVEHTSIGTKYLLEHCIFDESHTGKDAMIFQGVDGALGYHCFHNSCQSYTWRDVRLKFEPDAYDRNIQNQYQQNRDKTYYQKSDPKVFQPITESEECGPIWMKFSSIKRPRIDLADYIPSGIQQIDKWTLGFRRKKVSVWSGIKGAGKSSLLNCLILNAAQKKYKSALWTGELGDAEIKEWLYLQAAGKQYTRQKYENFYDVPDYIQDKIDSWIDNYVWLFNNRYDGNFEQIEYQIRLLKKQKDIDMVILDNLMMMDLKSLAEDKYERQSVLMDRLKKLAAELNIHIHLVAHPNKSRGFLRSDFISGTGDIANKADYIFLLHRIDFDFENNAKLFLPKPVLYNILKSDCTNCIEIDKCRDRGIAKGKFVYLYFEKESNRLKNDISENIIYNWNDQINSQEQTLGNGQLPWLEREESDLPF